MEKLTQQQIVMLQDIFESFDKNKSGIINCSEFENVMRTLGYNLSETQLHDIKEEFSVNSIAYIDFPMFLRLVCEQVEKISDKQNILKAFTILDPAGTGYIYIDELRYVLTTHNLTNEEVDALLEQMEVDDEGRIDYKEFVNLIISNV